MDFLSLLSCQKIVQNLEAGFKRLGDYVVPLEDENMKKLGYAGTAIGKILIFEREANQNRKIHLIFVKEKLGF